MRKQHLQTPICILITLLISSTSFAQSKQVLDAELSVARTNVYVNETVQIKLSIRSEGVNVGQDITINGMPQENRLIQVGEYRELAPEINIIDGIERRTRAFIGDFRPLNVGPITLKPELQLTLLTRRRSLFGTSVVQHSKHSLRVKPLKLSVMPLPKINVPASFEGAIGTFSFEADITPSNVQVGDLINVTTTIKGKGYLETVTPIGILPKSGFKTYDPKTTISTADKRKFVQTVVVTDTNTTAIPKMSFTYFDPEKSKYMTHHSKTLPITFHEKQNNNEIETFQPKISESPSTNRDALKDLTNSTIAYAAKATNHKSDFALIDSEQTLYFAPSLSSLITVEMPENAQVELLEKHDQWYKVQYKQNRGWIPKTALKK